MIRFQVNDARATAVCNSGVKQNEEVSQCSHHCYTSLEFLAPVMWERLNLLLVIWSFRQALSIGRYWLHTYDVSMILEVLCLALLFQTKGCRESFSCYNWWLLQEIKHFSSCLLHLHTHCLSNKWTTWLFTKFLTQFLFVRSCTQYYSIDTSGNCSGSEEVTIKRAIQKYKWRTIMM